MLYKNSRPIRCKLQPKHVAYTRLFTAAPIISYSQSHMLSGRSGAGVNWVVRGRCTCDGRYRRAAGACGWGYAFPSLAIYRITTHFYRATACNETHGIANAFLSVISSVCQSDKCVRPLLCEILVRLTLLERKRRFSNQYSLVAPQP